MRVYLCFAHAEKSSTKIEKSGVAPSGGYLDEATLFFAPTINKLVRFGPIPRGELLEVSFQ
jgi:hypothetical protein